MATEMDANTQRIIQWAKKSVRCMEKTELGVEDIFLGVLAEIRAGRLPAAVLAEGMDAQKLQWPPEMIRLHAEIEKQPEIEESVKYPLSAELRTLVQVVHAETRGKLDAPVLVRRLLETRHAWVADFVAKNRKGPGETGIFAKLDAVSRKTAALKTRLNEVVLGQRPAIDMLASAFFRASVFRLPGMPQGIFTLMGPPGVGKTLLAETFALVLGEIEGQEYALLKLDMSGYSAHQSHEQLFGFAKAYQNSSPGLLTLHVKKNPRSVILFDEIEKAHYNTITALLPVLDKASAYDNQLGETVDFSQSWIFFTSNLGQEFFAEANTSGILDSGAGMTLAFDVLQNARKSAVATGGAETSVQALPPEFVSRLAKGGGVVFSPLGVTEYMDLVHNWTRTNTRTGADLPAFEIDDDVKFLFLASLLPDVDARRTVAATSRWVTGLMQESFEACRDAIRRANPERYTVRLQAQEPAAALLRERLHLEPVRLLVIDDDDYIPGMLEKVHFGLPFVLKRIDDRQDAAKEALRFSPDMVLLDASIGEGAGSSRVEKSLHILDLVRRTLPEVPVILFSENPQDRHNLDQEIGRIVAAGGARGFVPLVRGEELQESDFAARVMHHLWRCDLSRTFLELRKRHVSVETRIAWSFDADSKEIRGLVGPVTTRTHIGVSAHYDHFQFSGIPSETFDSVVGLNRAKRRLADVVEWMKNPRRLQEFAVTPPRGFLLAGPPGTGKTLLARAVAGEAKLPFLAISAGELESKWVGESEERIRQLFAKAREYAPSIVFIDEIDGIAQKRADSDTAGSLHHGRVLNQLLASMDGFSRAHRPIFVLAATNRPDVLDPALRRPGRFDEIIPIDLPNAAARREFLQKFLAMRADIEDLSWIVARTAGCSPAQLDRVVREAAYLAARDGEKRIQERHLKEAVLLVVFGASREDMEVHRDELERTAWHEAGHAIAMAALFPERTIEYVSIVPSESGALGFVAAHRPEDRHDLTREEVFREIQVKLAGRAAEQMIYGDSGISAGASDDIERANRLALMAVARWGMGGDLPPLCDAAGSPAFQQAVWARALPAVEHWLSKAAADTCNLLGGRRGQLERLARLLLERESLEFRDIVDAGILPAKS